MIGRRTALGWLGAAPMVLWATPTLAFFDTGPTNVVIVIADIGPQTDAAALGVVLDVFTSLGLPVSCCIETNSADGTFLKPDTPLAQVLYKHAIKTPGLVELAPFVRDLGALSPYFQARAVFDAQHNLAGCLNAGGTTANALRKPTTVGCDAVANPNPPSGVRSAAVRNVLMRPTVTSPVQSQAWKDGVLRLIGGVRTQMSRPSNLMGNSDSTVERVVYLSANDVSATGFGALKIQAESFANDILGRGHKQGLNTVLAADTQLRDNYGYTRRLALHFALDDTAEAEQSTTLKGFRQDLLLRGLGSSFGPRSSIKPSAEDAFGCWINLARRAPNDDQDMPVLAMPSIPQPAYHAGVLLTDIAGARGIDNNNHLIAPTFFINDTQTAAGLTSKTFDNTDMVIIISASVLFNPPIRTALFRNLVALLDDSITQILPLPQYVRDVLPKSPYITHFQRTESHRAEMHKRTLPKDLQELMTDAQVAWSYFDKWTNKTTGLCPATVNFANGGLRLHETVTMWDVGSHINALMAAVDLKLIPVALFQRAIQLILPNIAGRRSDGRLLPQGWIRTDRFKWGVKDFDGCDAGRLMCALYNLETHPAARDKPAQTVTAWDLKDVVMDGQIQSVTDGQFQTTYRSHCAHYAVRAFRTWGLDAISPYEVFSGKSDSDGKMALLEVAGHIGPMGAEPLLLEAVELGISAESSYLADVLFAAQLEEYRETGVLTCVSEGPINRDPWFTYQGLQFDAPGRTWATDTVDSLPEHRSAAFRQRNLAISSKAAFLWAAYQDHPYSNILVDHVRTRARTDNGFASSILQSTGAASTNYTDINTNGIILQSIAQIFKDRQVTL